MPARYVAAIDQGTASSRCLVFDRRARIVSVAQKEHHHYFPRPGWVEHDPEEILSNVLEVVTEALATAELEPADLGALGIANQRETTVLWDRDTGSPVHNAINWEDTRTDQLCRELSRDGGQERFREKTGLPIATYFSGPKVRWLLDQVPGLRERAEAGEVLFGTIDSWLIWNLCGRHVTDVTNASRTMLMNLQTLRVGRRAARRVRRAPRDAPRDPPLVGDLRRGRRAAGRCAGRLAARRSARRASRPDLL